MKTGNIRRVESHQDRVVTEMGKRRKTNKIEEPINPSHQSKKSSPTHPSQPLLISQTSLLERVVKRVEVLTRG